MRAFNGISVAADGSEDYEINLKELEIPVLENLDTDEEPFANLSDDSFTEDSSSEEDPSSEED